METPSWNSPPPTFILLKWRKSNIESPKWHQISKPYISTFRPYGSYGFLGYIGIYLFREKFGGRDRDVCHTNPNPPTPPGAEVSLMHPKWSSSNPMVPQGLFNDPTKSPPKILVKKRRNTHTHTHTLLWWIFSHIYVGQFLFVEFLIVFPFLEMKHVYYIWPELKGRTNLLKKPAGRKLLVSLCTENCTI